MYACIARIQSDAALTRRITACAAVEGIGGASPDGWAYQHMWTFAAQPGWGEAWESATAGGITDPGSNEGVITDGMILSAAQAIHAAEGSA